MANEDARLYEGLFLINPIKIASNLGTATQIVRELLDRAGAEVLSIARWDERKLAYEIKGCKRGLYMLAYFNVDGRKVASIERDVNLSENVVRCLILRAEHVGETELELAKQEEAKTLDAARLQGEEKPEADTEPEAEPAAAAE